MMWATTHAQTTIPGGNVSGTWTKAGSPYMVNGYITIPDGKTLTIEPGVTVKFGYEETGTEYPPFYYNYSMSIKGRIVAKGEATDSIVFTFLDTDHQQWGGLRFDNIPEGNDTSILQYCVIKDVASHEEDVASHEGSGGIEIHGCHKLKIVDCNIRKNRAFGYDMGSSASGGGIHVSYSTVVIINSNINNNSSTAYGNYGGGLYANESTVSIYNSIIDNNYYTSYGQGDNIYTYKSTLTITNSDVINSGEAIYSRESTVHMIGGTIKDNSHGIIASGGEIIIDGCEIKNEETNITCNQGSLFIKNCKLQPITISNTTNTLHQCNISDCEIINGKGYGLNISGNYLVNIIRCKINSVPNNFYLKKNRVYKPYKYDLMEILKSNPLLCKANLTYC